MTCEYSSRPPTCGSHENGAEEVEVKCYEDGVINIKSTLIRQSSSARILVEASWCTHWVDGSSCFQRVPETCFPI